MKPFIIKPVWADSVCITKSVAMAFFRMPFKMRSPRGSKPRRVQ